MKKTAILLLVAFLISGSTLKDEAFRPNRDYALFFAVNDYQPGSGFDDLSKPIENAEAVAKELRERYSFSTEVVKNPTLDQISAKLREYQAFFAKNPQGKYPSTGQLLIYFTGHGISEDNNGYFVPSDGNSKKLYSTAFAYEIWRPFINQMDCRHILVAIDACYSVTFDPDWYNKKMDPGAFKRPGELSEGDKLLLANETDKCRIVFTSDGEEDKVPERSNFARKFIEGLQAGPRQDGILTSEGLAAYLRFAAPKPRLTEFGDDQKGSFLFVQVAAYSAADAAKKAEEAAGAASLEKDLAGWRVAKAANTIAAYQKYLADFPSGEFREQAQAGIRSIENDLAIRRDDLAWEVAAEKNTVDGYNKYISDFPNGRHTNDAKENINKLKKVNKTPQNPATIVTSDCESLIAELNSNIIRTQSMELIIRGGYKYGIDFFSNEKGVFGRITSFGGIELNQDDQVVFVDNTGKEMAYKYINLGEVVAGAVPTHRNNLQIDLDAVKWLSESNIVGVNFINFVDRQKYKFTISSDRQEKFKNLTTCFYNLIKE